MANPSRPHARHWLQTPLARCAALLVAALVVWQGAAWWRQAQGESDDAADSSEGTTSPGDSTVAEDRNAPSGEEGTHGPRLREVEAAVRHYFETWSAGRMDDYGRCFHAEGVIQMRDRNGAVQTFLKGPFVDWQRQLVRRATEPMVETPEKIVIAFEQDVARVEVLWKLRAGTRTDYGYDHFTMIKEGNRWQIVHLLFYSIPAPG